MLQVAPAPHLAPSLRPGALPVARGLAGSWQDPAAGWRGSSPACSHCGGSGCTPGIRGCQGSQGARDHSVAMGSSAVTELVTVGTERQPSRCPAWQPGTLPMGPSGILSGSFQKPHCPFLLPGEWQIGERAFGWQSTPALLSWAPRAGLESPPFSPVPARGSVLPCGSRAWLWRVDHLSRGRRQRGSLAKPWPHPGHQAPHWCCDTGVSAVTPLKAAAPKGLPALQPGELPGLWEQPGFQARGRGRTVLVD